MIIESKYAGRCSACRTAHEAGDKVDWKKGRKGVRCEACAASGKTGPLTPGREKPVLSNQSSRVDCVARALPERAALATILLDKGAEPEAMAGELARLVRDFHEVLSSGDYVLRFPAFHERETDEDRGPAHEVIT